MKYVCIVVLVLVGLRLNWSMRNQNFEGILLVIFIALVAVFTLAING